ncbi:MAG: glutamine cyclotransferase [Patiriisocius sp.]|jgi:glutamine cyclotransferase
MKCTNFFIILLLAIFITGCSNKNQDPNTLFLLEIEGNKKAISASETINFTVKSKKGNSIDTVMYTVNKEEAQINSALKGSFNFSDKKLGIKNITAKIVSDGATYSISKRITVLAPQKPILYDYRILETYPHDINAYTQGLEFVGDVLYESTGQYGASSLRKTNYKTGAVEKNIPLKSQYFGEGLTILKDKLYQLTWRKRVGFIYNLETLKKTGTFAYNQSKQGWGLCNDGTSLYKSDGTSKIWKLNGESLAEEDYIEMYTNNSKIDSVNELEWIDGAIYANIYQKNAIAIINPNNGAIQGVINLKGLKKKVTQHAKLDVLNGIASKGEPNIIYVTGKNWDKLFKIEFFEKIKT